MHGFETLLLPVTHPGVEQKATWLQIRQNRPDYVLLWGWGVMNSTAIKEAVAVGYPRDKMYGVWWSGAEPDVRPAEDGAKGYNSVTLQHTAGQFKLHEDLKKHVYDKGQGSAKWEETGEILYVRGLIDAMLGVEAIRTAQEKFGKKPLTGEQVRWGLENLDLTAERIKELGFEGVLQPIKVSCADHEGARTGRIQTWDGKNWKITSDWYTSDDNVIAPMVKEAAAKYAAEKKITPGCLHQLMPVPVDTDRNAQEAARAASFRLAATARTASRPRAAAAPILVGQQHRGRLRPRHPGAQGRVARGAQGRDRGAARRQRRRQVDHAQGDLQPAVGRARRGHQGLDRVRRRRGARAHAQRAGAARLHPGDGRPPLLRPSHGRGEPADRRLHAARRQGGDQARPRAGLFLFPAPQGAPRLAPPATPRAASSRCARSAAR